MKNAFAAILLTVQPYINKERWIQHPVLIPQIRRWATRSPGVFIRSNQRNLRICSNIIGCVYPDFVIKTALFHWICAIFKLSKKIQQCILMLNHC